MQIKLLQIYKSIKDVPVNCLVPESSSSFRSSKNLSFPINVARNVARDAALTYFVFPSDIELYPSDNLVKDFLMMIANDDDDIFHSHRVFPLPVYEVALGTENPHNKTQLLGMLKKKQASLFHQSFCARCHRVPEGRKWETVPQSPSNVNLFTF